MKIKKIYTVIGFIAILIILAIIGIMRNRIAYDDLKKNGAVIIATVTSISGGRGAFEVHLQYQYEGKVFYNSIGTYHPDTLKVNQKIKLLISKQHPEGYVYSLGLINK